MVIRHCTTGLVSAILHASIQNACNSRFLHTHWFPPRVTWKTSVQDHAAFLFSEGFYLKLAELAPSVCIDQAYDNAMQQMQYGSEDKYKIGDPERSEGAGIPALTMWSLVEACDS